MTPDQENLWKALELLYESNEKVVSLSANYDDHADKFDFADYTRLDAELSVMATLISTARWQLGMVRK